MISNHDPYDTDVSKDHDYLLDHWIEKMNSVHLFWSTLKVLQYNRMIY